jgi:oxaloacetate decarboxylase alpha subunit
VLSGRRWHIVPDEMKAYLRGKYGAAPGPVSREVIMRVLGDEEPIHVRPADLVMETLEDYREEIGDLARSEEDLLSYALFPQTARPYLERHHIGPESDVFGTQVPAYLAAQAGSVLGDNAADRVKDILTMVEESGIDEVVIEQGDLKMTVRKAGALAPAAVAPAAPAVAARAGQAAAAEGDALNGYHMVRSKWVATFYRSPSPQSPSFVEVGDAVEAGQTLCILEMMKMMNELTADVAGVVREILVEDGETVQYGQPLFALEPI